ncbi:MAG: polysaccharide deacetylase family protein [archaeon]|jgi:peptidoglycan/xylan/chitin deacetylase (PgdA/CDA1 family)|nr:polysaccharide deacetylase family protein [archaeon]
MAQKKIFLTFDDGPGPKTVDLAELLNKLGIKATFFMVGLNIQTMPGAVKRVAELGHEIGVHAFRHEFLPKLNMRQTVYEIGATANLIEQITGKKPTVFRAAYGRLSSKALAVLEKLGLKHVDWSYDTKDWKKAEELRILDPKEIIKKAKAGDVILFHDGAVGRDMPYAGKRGQNLLRALPTVVNGLRTKGFEFEPIEKQFQKGQRFKYRIRTRLKELRAKFNARKEKKKKPPRKKHK